MHKKIIFAEPLPIDPKISSVYDVNSLFVTKHDSHCNNRVPR